MGAWMDRCGWMARTGRWRGRRRASRGQALPLVALVCWLVAGVALLAAALGARALRQAQVQVGADAVALAEAVAPGGGAATAAANGVGVAELRVSDRVEVVVTLGEQRAAAAAELMRPGWQGLRPELRAALARAEVRLGETIPIVSGFRSRAEQEALWANRDTNPYPVAVPGTSMHEVGLAVDVPSGFVPRLVAVIGGTGLCQPLPESDPVHFVLCHVTPIR